MGKWRLPNFQHSRFGRNIDGFRTNQSEHQNAVDSISTIIKAQRAKRLDHGDYQRFSFE
jgi:hypothetical protein